MTGKPRNHGFQSPGQVSNHANHLLELAAKTLTATTLTLSLLVISSSLLAYALFHPQILRVDSWPLYSRYIHEPFWQSIWTSWHGHRLFFPGLLNRINLMFFHANLANLVTVGLIAQALSAWTMSRPTAAVCGSRLQRWLTTGLIFAVLFWLGNQPAMIKAFGLTYTLGILGVVVACYCIWRCAAASSRQHRLWLCATLAASVLATLSWGSGAVIWPVLLLMALALKLPRSSSISILISGFVVVTAYIIPAPGDIAKHIPVPENFSSIVAICTQTLNFLGVAPVHILLPITKVSPTTLSRIAPVFSAIELILFVALVTLWWRQRGSRHWLIFYLGITLFVLGTALLFGIAQPYEFIMPTALDTRYCIFSALGWLSLFIGFMTLRNEQSFSRRQRIPSLSALILLIAIVPSQWHDFTLAGQTSNRIQEATLNLVTGVNNPFITKRWFWYFSPGMAQKTGQYLQQHHLSVFRRPWTHWEATKLPGASQTRQTIRGGLHISPRDKQIISGPLAKSGKAAEIGGIRISIAHPDSWWLSGWINNPPKNALIVGVDHDNRIRAMAHFTRDCQNAPAAAKRSPSDWLNVLNTIDPNLPAILGWGCGWFGLAPRKYKPDTLRYYLVKPDKQIIARIRFLLNPSIPADKPTGRHKDHPAH